VVTPDAKRKAESYLETAYGVSERRACAAMAVDRSTIRYQSKRPDDEELRDQVKQIASERRRFGYRRIHVLLEREGGPGEPEEVTTDLQRREAAGEA